LWVAHKEASAALAPAASYTSSHDEVTRNAVKTLKAWIESVLDVEGIASADPLTWRDTATTEEEHDYRQWCLVHYLYLNPSNDLGPYSVAAGDSMGLASHVVPLDAPYTFESFFDQMKQEYVSARWLLYEGLTAKVPHFSDRDVLLQVSEPRPSLCLSIEKAKTAYRISYSLFDKIGFFVNAYMKLGIPERQVSFRTLWRSDEKKPIRKEFDLTGNWGVLCFVLAGQGLFREGE
jgi:hypothetical protein